MNDVLLKVPAKAHNNNKKFAVIFSSANSSAFTYYKTFLKYNDLSLIFIRDPFLQRWYQSGIGYGINSWADLISYLNDELVDINPANISFWGSSMGGYAALKAASAFPGSTCFAFSPQTVLNNKLPHNIKDASYAHPDSHIDFSGRASVLNNILIVVGAADPVDIHNFYLSGLSSNNVLPIFEGDHLVSAYLHKIGFFNDCIKHWIKYSNTNIMQLVKKYSLDLDLDVYRQQYCKLVSDTVTSYYLGKDYESSLGYLNELLLQNANSGLYMLKGHIHAHQSDFHNADFCFTKALSLSSTILEPAKQYADILKKNKNFAMAIHYFSLALTARNNDYDSLCGLSECYAITGSADLAKENIVKAIGIRPSSSRAFKIVSRFGIDIHDQQLKL